MKRAIITVGLGFGDEGKGAAVDYLVRRCNAGLVVRYCGGAQAGHNVELPDGRRHTFSQFGAGTFAGAKTFLGERVIISPTSMIAEAEHLRQLGIAAPWNGLSVHPGCLVASGYHAWMNRLREYARGDDRHGSCGMGIGEARSYWLRYGEDAIFAADLRDPNVLRQKLILLRDRFLIEMQQFPKLDRICNQRLHATSPQEETELLLGASSRLELRSSMPAADTVVFEGSQGLLLDEWKGLHPYTTWSTVTPQHAWELVAEAGDVETFVLGLTRCYATRHGAGPLPTFCPRLTSTMSDPGNPANDWQGAMRFGPLDLTLLEYSARVCNVDGIFVSGLDQFPAIGRLATGYRELGSLGEPSDQRGQRALTRSLSNATPIYCSASSDQLLARIDRITPLAGTAHGPTHRDRELRHDFELKDVEPSYRDRFVDWLEKITKSGDQGGGMKAEHILET